MKTYLMNIPEILRSRSNELDVKAALCRTSWVVFNDDSVRLLFIFENDGSLIVSKNGVVSRQRWSYIRANSTVLIEDAQQQAFLFHPAFIDNVIFALQQDGTQHYLFMIDERQQERLSFSTIQSLNQYFTVKADAVREVGGRIGTAPPPINPPIAKDDERKKREEREKKRIEAIERRISEELSPLRDEYENRHKKISIISWAVGVPLGLIALVLMTIGVFSLSINDTLTSIIWMIGVGVILFVFIGIICLIPDWILNGYEKEIDKKRDCLMQKYLKEKE